jgi:thiol-disulfide isomerase/thioredoxin
MTKDGPSANRPPHILLEPAPLLSFRLLTAAVLGCALLAGGCDRQSGETAQPELSAVAPDGGGAQAGEADRSHKGEPLPELTVGDPEGARLDLRSLKGSPVLINLWATWCAPCVAELPTLEEIATRSDMKLRVVTISQDSGEPDKVRAFLEKRGLTRLPAWLDPENDVSFHYGISTLPTTILYDAGGREVWRYAGDLDWTGKQAAALLQERCPGSDPSC